jgi:hypothetical protein
VTTPYPGPVQTQIETKTPIKVQYPVPSKRLVEFIKTGSPEVKRDFLKYMAEVEGLGKLVGK